MLNRNTYLPQIKARIEDTFVFVFVFVCVCVCVGGGGERDGGIFDFFTVRSIFSSAVFQENVEVLS